MTSLKPTPKKLGNSLPFRAITLPSRAISVAGRGTAAVGDPQTPYFYAAQVSDTKLGAISRLSQENKGEALACSLLRHVWTFREAHRAETGFWPPLAQAKARQKPAYRAARSASISRPSVALVALLLLCSALAVLPSPASSQGGSGGWGSSDAFSDSQARQMREKLAMAPKVSKSGWGSQIASEADVRAWVSMDAFERSKPGKRRPRVASFRLPNGTKVDQLFAVIALAEAPRAGYNAIHHSAKRLPSKKPTEMTLCEVFTWIKATPKQHHAIGRFQIIPSTLASLQRRLGLPCSTTFNKATQDRMASLLIADAGYHDLHSGRITQARFMDNLARIWAGLPLASGKSAYHNYAGNRATITRSFYEKQVAKIFGSIGAQAS